MKAREPLPQGNSEDSGYRGQDWKIRKRNLPICPVGSNGDCYLSGVPDSKRSEDDSGNDEYEKRIVMPGKFGHQNERRDIGGGNRIGGATYVPQLRAEPTAATGSESSWEKRRVFGVGKVGGATFDPRMAEATPTFLP